MSETLENRRWRLVYRTLFMILIVLGTKGLKQNSLYTQWLQELTEETRRDV